MDSIDLNILDLLKENSRMTSSDISKKVNLSIPAVSERIRKMEEAGTIEKFTVRVNREKTGYKLLAFIYVTIDRSEHIENFRKTVVKFNPVLECHHIAGEYDYLLKVAAEDTRGLENFITKSLKKIKGILKTNTVIVLTSIKEEINL